MVGGGDTTSETDNNACQWTGKSVIYFKMQEEVANRK